jgi:hypothetical protein
MKAAISLCCLALIAACGDPTTQPAPEQSETQGVQLPDQHINVINCAELVKESCYDHFDCRDMVGGGRRMCRASEYFTELCQTEVNLCVYGCEVDVLFQGNILNFEPGTNTCGPGYHCDPLDLTCNEENDYCNSSEPYHTSGECQALCDDGLCVPGEDTTCPKASDCDRDDSPTRDDDLAVCGDGFCEDSELPYCYQDCALRCGNLVCEPTADENHLNCPSDCLAPYCGDGWCGPGENNANCPQDCEGPSVGGKSYCGDGVCNMDAGETEENCPEDCEVSSGCDGPDCDKILGTIMDCKGKADGEICEPPQGPQDPPWTCVDEVCQSPCSDIYPDLQPGDTVRQCSSCGLYYVDNNCERHAFTYYDVYYSWFGDTDDVKVIPAEDIAAMPLVGNIVIRPGTFLVKLTSSPKVYAVGPAGTLFHVISEAAAQILYGPAWGFQTKDVPDAHWALYSIAYNDLDGTKHPIGQLIRKNDQVYYINSLGTHSLVTEAGFQANNFSCDYVIDVPSDWPIFPGPEISEKIPALADPSINSFFP